MTTDNIKTYTTCDIDQALLQNFDNSKQIDIRALIGEMSITESIYSQAVQGVIKIYDSIGLIEDFPLRGEERITFVITGNDFKTVKKIEAFVYSISDIMVNDTTDAMIYSLFFTTTKSFLSKYQKVTTAFQKPISEMVVDIFDQTYDNIKQSQMNVLENSTIYKMSDERTFTVENTWGDIRLIIPNYNPADALTFLSSRAASETSKSCSFKFFETVDGYYFVTDEFLIKKANGSREGIKELYFNDDMNIGADNIENLTKRIENLTNSKRVDSIGDIMSGAYNSNIIELDVFEKRTVDNRFKYSENRDSFTKTNGKRDTSPASDIHSKEFVDAFFVDTNETKYIFVKDYDSYNNLQIKGNSYIPYLTNFRKSYEHILNSVQVDVDMKGRLDIRAGDIVNLSVKSFSSINKEKINKQLSGAYIVSSVNNHIKAGVLSSKFGLLKFGWEQSDVVEV